MEVVSEFKRTWVEGFYDYAADIARIYKVRPEEIKNCFQFYSVVGSLNETYLALVKEKQLSPIESLDMDRKNELWTEAKKYSTDKAKCILISRSIYLLDTLTK